MLWVPVGPGVVTVGWPLAVAAAQLAVNRYMRAFWESKAKIPLLDEYNLAVSDTIYVIGFLNVLAVGWAAIAVLKAVGF